MRSWGSWDLNQMHRCSTITAVNLARKCSYRLEPSELRPTGSTTLRFEHPEPLLRLLHYPQPSLLNLEFHSF